MKVLIFLSSLLHSPHSYYSAIEFSRWNVVELQTWVKCSLSENCVCVLFMRMGLSAHTDRSGLRNGCCRFILITEKFFDLPESMWRLADIVSLDRIIIRSTVSYYQIIWEAPPYSEYGLKCILLFLHLS